MHKGLLPSKAHLLVRQLQNNLVKGRIEKGCISSTRDVISVRVGPESISRALAIMNSLISKLADKDINPVIKTEGYKSGTFVEVAGEAFEIDMYEKINIITSDEKDWLGQPKRDYIPNGKLILRIKNAPYTVKSEWKDGKRKKLEDQIDSFIDGLYRAAEREKELEIERQKRNEEYRKEEERRNVAQREQEKIKALEEEAMRWHRSTIIKNYIDAATKTYLDQHDNIEAGSDFGKWRNWSKNVVDNLNPAHKRVSGEYFEEEREELL